MKRLLFFIAFMTLGTAALIELLVTPPKGPVRPSRHPAQISNVLNMNTVVVNEILGEHTRWELHATHALYDENTNTGDLRHVRFKIYKAEPGAENEVAFAGHSDEAQLSRNPDNVVLIGGVVLTQSDGLEIRSDRVEYDAANQVVISPGPTRVRSPQGEEEGASLRYSVPQQKLHLTSPLFVQ